MLLEFRDFSKYDGQKRSEFLFEDVSAFKVCTPRDAAPWQSLLTTHKLLGIILETTSALPHVVLSFWQKAAAVA